MQRLLKLAKKRSQEAGNYREKGVGFKEIAHAAQKLALGSPGSDLFFFPDR